MWLQGNQSSSTSGSSEWLGLNAFSIAWLEVIIPCVLMTPLGVPVEPEVNRNLPIVSGVTRACAASTAGLEGVA